ncbi:MAG: hypothetical protein RLZZ390_1246 [Bacteroidota bacterium]|jgi:uncharacterized protein YdeI (YjbR/CyaY-like superfamily)
MNQDIEQFFEQVKFGKDILLLLRKTLLNSTLTEEYKWKQPCYTLKGKNVIILAGLKDHVIISFFKGALLKNENDILQKAGENSQAARIIRLYTLDEAKSHLSFIKASIKAAIEIEKKGAKVEKHESAEIEIPVELHEVFKKDADYKKAYFKLTPGRQRAYLIFFTGAKQSETKFSRIEKYRKRIMDGYGFNDCVCGLSKRKPSCDGSHKVIPDFKY